MLISLSKRWCLLAALVALACTSLAGASIHPVVRSCWGTMKLTSNRGVSLITIDKASDLVPPDGSCSFEGSTWKLGENPVFDFWIRVTGNHTAAFDLAYGQSGIGYPGYMAYQDHVINIVGSQTGVPEVGTLGDINDGSWRHVIFDVGYAIESQPGFKPGSAEEIDLALFDRQGSLDIFSGAPTQTYPTRVELRDMVWRPRIPGEHYNNDLAFSISTAAVGATSHGESKYLAGGYVVSRRPLTGARIVAEIPQGPATTETVGDIQGRRDIAFAMSVPPRTPQMHVKLVDSAGNVLMEKDLKLLPELAALRGATINIIPNSHNDIAWLDTPEATANWRRDKVLGPALPLLEKYPD